MHLMNDDSHSHAHCLTDTSSATPTQSRQSIPSAILHAFSAVAAQPCTARAQALAKLTFGQSSILRPILFVG